MTKIAGREYKTVNLIVIAIVASLFIALIIYFIATNNSGAVNPNGKTVDASDLVSNPTKYKNYSVEFMGKVFAAEGKAGEQALQIFSDAENSNGNIVVYNYSKESFRNNDFVNVKGTVLEASKGENAFGAKLTVPIVTANSIKKVDPDVALAPALKVSVLNKSKSVGGLTVTLKKVEYAKDETRLYLTFDNKTSEEYQYYDFNSTLIQDRTNIKQKSVYDRGDTSTTGEVPANTSEDVKSYYSKMDSKAPTVFTAEVTNLTNYEVTKLEFPFN